VLIVPFFKIADMPAVDYLAVFVLTRAGVKQSRQLRLNTLTYRLISLSTS